MDTLIAAPPALDDPELGDELEESEVEPHRCAMRRFLKTLAALYIAPTAAPAVGTVATPTTLGKTFRFHAQHLVPASDITSWDFSANGVNSRTINVTANFVGIVQLPIGVTLTGWRIRGKR